ncbi:MAG TPA: hypothetical protein VN661_01420 [Candidatus Acidoferrales bacterium]|nr:hypothetical protein [Candidatus Acidoferrales bacterium]
MNVRRYRPDDVASIARVFTESVRLTSANDYSTEQIAAWAPDPPNLED